MPSIIYSVLMLIEWGLIEFCMYICIYMYVCMYVHIYIYILT